MRLEAVEAITRSHFVKVTPAEQAMIDRASEADHRAAAVAVFHAREARRLLEEMGILKVPTVLDMTRADVDRLGKRADAARRAMYELDATGIWREDMPLSQALKVAKGEQTAAAIRILRAGGFREVDDLTMAGIDRTRPTGRREAARKAITIRWSYDLTSSTEPCRCLSTLASPSSGVHFGLHR